MNIYYYIYHHCRDEIHAPWRMQQENGFNERYFFASMSEDAVHHVKIHTSGMPFGVGGLIAGLHNFIMSQVTLTALDYMEYNRTRARTETLET